MISSPGGLGNGNSGLLSNISIGRFHLAEIKGSPAKHLLGLDRARQSHPCVARPRFREILRRNGDRDGFLKGVGSWY